MLFRRPFSAELFLALKRHGHSALLQTLVAEAQAQGVGVDASLAMRLRQQPIEAPRVRAPVIDPEGRESVFCAIDVREGDEQRPSYLDECAWQSVREALDAAWQRVGGPTRRPPCAVRIELAELGGFSIRGPSLFLAVLIAAAALFSESVLPGDVLATGHFGVALDAFAPKSELVERLDRALQPAMLLFASAKEMVASGSAQCLDAGDALRRVFGHVPWHRASAEVRRVHLHCGDERATPPEFLRRYDPQLIALDDRITREAFEGVRRRVLAALEGSDRVELSVGGPVHLAAYLGGALKNHRAMIRFVDLHTNEPWWHNRMPSMSIAGAAPARSDATRLLAAAREVRAIDGWTTVRLVTTPRMTSQMVLPAVRRLCEAIPATGEVHLGVCGPLGLAWALGHTFANSRAIHWHSFDSRRGAYDFAFVSP